MIDSQVEVRVALHRGPASFPYFAIPQDQNHPTGKAEEVRKGSEFSLEPVDALIVCRGDQPCFASQGATVFDSVDTFPDLRHGVSFEGWVQASGQLRREWRVSHEELVGSTITCESYRRNLPPHGRLRDDFQRLGVVNRQTWLQGGF